MKFRFLALLTAPALALGIAACDVDQTEEGELPDVEVEGGNLPEYEVEGPDVDVGRDTVVIPDIDIDDADDDTTATVN